MTFGQAVRGGGRQCCQAVGGDGWRLQGCEASSPPSGLGEAWARSGLRPRRAGGRGGAPVRSAGWAGLTLAASDICTSSSTDSARQDRLSKEPRRRRPPHRVAIAARPSGAHSRSPRDLLRLGLLRPHFRLGPRHRPRRVSLEKHPPRKLFPVRRAEAARRRPGLHSARQSLETLGSLSRRGSSGGGDVLPPRRPPRPPPTGVSEGGLQRPPRGRSEPRPQDCREGPVQRRQAGRLPARRRGWGWPSRSFPGSAPHSDGRGSCRDSGY